MHRWSARKSQPAKTPFKSHPLDGVNVLYRITDAESGPSGIHPHCRRWHARDRCPKADNPELGGPFGRGNVGYEVGSGRAIFERAKFERCGQDFGAPSAEPMKHTSYSCI
jgi:hypothetical protein